MLKLIIADDERMIRETISVLIDWNAYDIQLVGLCKNGMDAYDMILDESPDIVLTDIKMPGMDGLELIQKISETDLLTRFIILSGYGEFEYAKQAMKYGVKHYLLKPCNEQQIIESIRDIASDCYQNQLSRYSVKSRFLAADSMSHNVLFGIINDTIYQNTPFQDTLKTYELYMDFHFTAYRLFYVYYLEPDSLESFLGFLKEYCRKEFPAVTVHGIYTSPTLLIFFKEFAEQYPDFLRYLSSFPVPNDRPRLELEIRQELFPNLERLLQIVLKKIRRYSMIYYISQFHILPSFNYNFVMAESERLYPSIRDGSPDAMKQLEDLFHGIPDLGFLKQLLNSLLLKITACDPSMSTVRLAESLLFIQQETDPDRLKQSVFGELHRLQEHRLKPSGVSSMTQQIFSYVEEHIQDPNLTLKYISEQYLFMNTDYVSKKFQKETGIRFSAYLTSVRIRKAKEYLAGNGSDKIQTVAEMVGCGNNPQYFSQLFKKNTGLSPSAYVTKLHTITKK